MATPLFRRVLRATERGAFPGLRRWIWRRSYNLLSRLSGTPRWAFLNYGYIGPGAPFALRPEEEPSRPFVGLYHQAVEGLPLKAASVLEVGSGHGGGAAYVARHYAVDAVTGVDIARQTVRRAIRLNAGVPRLTFREGDAEALPFPDASFDIVVNVESSHCYGSMDRFAAEAARVLRPGGWLTWADMRSPAMLPDLDNAFARAGLVLRTEAEINEGVVAALDAMEAAKSAAITRIRPLRPVMRQFAGMQGSVLYRALQRRRVLYLARRYQKPG
ncbi:class I SAM-dependent methyltransferase [Pararoseomonas indoligenes]|uniref:Class I SAM-dependent methyltransferase n=1 Tax=Roseomonas indoligenes TaxID=2820811 RepID=A0A940MUR3_9PROT|nr:class I SAM-dependent methyltransferase [Pararoseomonas indoligenes]MBP0492351.1 class I SAM-dependent methyltransferase [Pararoseomonas indoligenes]